MKQIEENTGFRIESYTATERTAICELNQRRHWSLTVLVVTLSEVESLDGPVNAAKAEILLLAPTCLVNRWLFSSPVKCPLGRLHFAPMTSTVIHSGDLVA